MTEAQPTKGKVDLLREVAEVRSQVEHSGTIGIRAQEDIYRILDEALTCLEGGDTDRLLNEAAFKIMIARQRGRQAEGRRTRLAVLIGVWLGVWLALGAWGIYEGEYWPKGGETAGRDILFGAVLWGLVGAAVDGLRELHTRLARQELDRDRLGWYVCHPLLGAGLGGVLFLIVSAGLLATGQDAGDFNPSLPLILAAAAGFEQQNVIRYLRDTIRQILRIQEQSPNEGG